MRQYLDLLINLQGVDLQIKDHSNTIANILKDKEKLQQEWLKYQQGFEQLKVSCDEIQKRRRKYELDLEAKEAEVKKYKGQVLSVKTNREYQSLLHEIEISKAAGEKMEEEILRLMEANDELQRQMKETQQKIKEKQNQVEQQGKEFQALLESHQKDKQTLQKQREELTQGIKSNLMNGYEKLLKSKGGIALAIAKDGICQGCFIRIMPQTYEEIKKREKVYHCPNCQRMLYTESRSNTEES